MAIAPELRAQILRLYQAERWRIGTIASQLVSVRPSHLAITRCAKDARVRFTSSRTYGHFEH